MGLTESEVRSALLLAILAIVIYPALPRGAIDPWGMVEPRAAWVTVLLIAGIGFVNYILWKLYGARGAELSGFLGGLVNSNFTVIEMASRVRETGGAMVDTAFRGIVLATAAMLVRNAALLLMLAPLALLSALGAFALMLLCCLVVVLWSYRQRAQLRPSGEVAPQIKLDLPFSLPQALKYGVVFLALHIVGGLTQRHFGDAGFYVVSVLGGLMSSASAVAAAATLAAQGNLSPTVAGTGAVMASFTSIAFSLSFVLHTGNRLLIGRMALVMLCVAGAGVVGLLVWSYVSPWLSPLLSLWLPVHG
jgi:uncharacterized membrane protein (DUF4010 family)